MNETDTAFDYSQLPMWDNGAVDAASLPPRWNAYPHRLPSSLDELRGPAIGSVEVPFHVAWSGRRVFNVSDPDQRLALYALLLAEGQREDIQDLIDSDALVGCWPRLRRLLGPHARKEWESRLIPPGSW